MCLKFKAVPCLARARFVLPKPDHHNESICLWDHVRIIVFCIYEAGGTDLMFPSYLRSLFEASDHS